MATRVRTETDVHCDRCGRRISTPRDHVGLSISGPTTAPAFDRAGGNMIDMCKPCEASFRKWWKRGGKDEDDDEGEAAQ